MICLWGAYGCILGFVLIWYDMIRFGLVTGCTCLVPLSRLVLGGRPSMYTLWIDGYVIMWFETYSSGSGRSARGFPIFLCVYSSGSGRQAFVDTCSLILVTIWFILSLDSSYSLFIWLMIFVQLSLISYAFDRWYSFQQELMISFSYTYLCFDYSFCYISVHWDF